jgi:uncharacterized RDD family membrane protein YckC
VQVEGADRRIVTPEAVVLDLEPAGVGSRGVALLIDGALLFGTGLALFLVQLRFGLGGFVDGWLAIALALLLAFAVQFGYPVGFETLWRGRTLGKAAMGLRVVTVEGAPVGVRHASIRAAVGLVELTATLGALAAVVSLLSARSQRLGDLAAGTLVVRERRVTGAARSVEVFTPPPGLEQYTATIDTSAIGPAEYATLRDVLRRAPDMRPAARSRVTEELAARLTPRVTPPPPSGLDAWRWLTCVGAAVQRQHAPGTAGTSAPPTTSVGPPSWGAARPTPARTPEPPGGPGTSEGPPPPPPDADGDRQDEPRDGDRRDGDRRDGDDLAAGGFAPPG